MQPQEFATLGGRTAAGDPGPGGATASHHPSPDPTKSTPMRRHVPADAGTVTRNKLEPSHPSTGTGTRVGDVTATRRSNFYASRPVLGQVTSARPSPRSFPKYCPEKEGGGGPWESTALMCGSVWNTVPCSRRKRVTVTNYIRVLGLRYTLNTCELLCQQSLVPNTDRILAQHVGLVNPLGRKKQKNLHHILCCLHECRKRSTKYGSSFRRRGIFRILG